MRASRSSFVEEAFMKQHVRTTCFVALAVLSVPLLAQQADPSVNANCKPVFADLVEDASTDCKPGHTTCFLGQVDGNHGLRGQTYFRSDSGAAGPRTSPGFVSYSGEFEYVTDRGVLVVRETGVVNQAPNVPSSGAVTAHQQIVSGTDDFSGATGYLFVSGFNKNQHVVTKVTGEICVAK
jgi:hypothetical protein